MRLQLTLGLCCCADGSGKRQPLQLKLLRTAVGSADGAWPDAADPREVLTTKDALLLRCGDGRTLEVSPQTSSAAMDTCSSSP